MAFPIPQWLIIVFEGRCRVEPQRNNPGLIKSVLHYDRMCHEIREVHALLATISHPIGEHLLGSSLMQHVVEMLQEIGRSVLLDLLYDGCCAPDRSQPDARITASSTYLHEVRKSSSSLGRLAGPEHLHISHEFRAVVLYPRTL